MRGPLEDGKVSISRVNASLTYPCNFMLITSMNPCPCGYYGTKDKNCTCTRTQISKYINKISKILKMPAALAEDPGSIPSICKVASVQESVTPVLGI